MKRTLPLVLLALFAVLVSGCGVAKVVTSGDYTLKRGEVLGGDLVITSGQVTLEAGSHVTGQVLVTSGDLNANGEIDGDLVVTSGNAKLGPEAVVHGDIKSTSGNVNRAEGSLVEGQGSSDTGPGGLVAGAILTSCVLPLVLIGVLVGVVLFLFVGQRRRKQDVVMTPAVPAQAPADLEVSAQNLGGPPPDHTEQPKPRPTMEPGRYEILEEIGQGGFAIVYRAHDTKLDRPVALKELRSLLLQDTNWVKRFHQEARTIARLDHPRIVTIHDVYETQERLFIVMRLVDGPGLEELITSRGRLPWSVAEGLDYAHGQAILHRDMKPANILMDSERGPLLSDFGLAKLVGSNSMSATGDIVGTPHYIPPEAWEGEAATPQTDIYALGCILYELLTGEKVFKGETPPQVMMAHFSPLELPKVWPEGVPSGVADVLETALASQPADRYATAGEMAKQLATLTPEELAR
jgi:tRNA A-37 threonylcarbamoyl transferase component Bud32/cytoskeletal protein CcmA (bactofilin family)